MNHSVKRVVCWIRCCIVRDRTTDYKASVPGKTAVNPKSKCISNASVLGTKDIKVVHSVKEEPIIEHIQLRDKVIIIILIWSLIGI